MATNAERQAKYRAARATAGADGNGERRINTFVSTGAALALAQLASHYGVTQRAMLERLLLAERDRVTTAMDWDSPELAAFYGMEEPTDGV